MKTIVAIRIQKDTEVQLYEFKTKKDALLFIKDLKNKYGPIFFEYLIGTSKVKLI